jgi:hypothetical protein
VRSSPRCAAAATTHQATIEDQRDLVWAADIEDVADDLFEKPDFYHRVRFGGFVKP